MQSSTDPIPVPLPAPGPYAHATFAGRMQLLQLYMQRYLTALSVMSGAEPMAEAMVDQATSAGYADAMRRAREAIADLPQTPAVVRVNASIEAWLAVARLDAVVREQNQPTRPVQPQET